MEWKKQIPILLVAVLEERDLARALPDGVYDEYRKGTII